MSKGRAYWAAKIQSEMTNEELIELANDENWNKEIKTKGESTDMSMNYNEEEELKSVNKESMTSEEAQQRADAAFDDYLLDNKQPTDREIITALRFELIRTQKAYLMDQIKLIHLQIESLNMDEQKLLSEGW